MVAAGRSADDVTDGMPTSRKSIHDIMKLLLGLMNYVNRYSQRRHRFLANRGWQPRTYVHPMEFHLVTVNYRS